MKSVAATLLLVVSIGHTFLADMSHHSANPAAAPTIGDFALHGHDGRPHSLSDFADKKLVVVVFLGNRCPLAQAYGPVLAGLAARYVPRGVPFLGINANAQDPDVEVARYVKDCGISFPMLRDPDQTVANRFGAERTPEAFVLDERRTVRYHGRIDDRTTMTRGAEPRQRYLAEALEDLLAGRPIPTPHVPAIGCMIPRPVPSRPTGEVTYTGHIRPILTRRCAGCHRHGEIAPFALTGYKEIAAWSATIRDVVTDGRMPPWHANPRFGHFRNDARLPPKEKRLLLKWIDDGCPEGGAAVSAPAAPLAPGWQIAPPDLVLWMSAQPWRVPADQAVEYQYFLVDPEFREDKYIQAAEVRPGNRAVVHHALVSLVRPDADGKLPDSLGAMLNYAPGMQPTTLPAGWAIHVPAGSKFLFQMHYTPNGKEQTDRSYLGLVFADPATVKHKVHGGAVVNPHIDIPAGAKAHRETAEHVFATDVRLLSLSPHMHLRGKSFRIEAVYPDLTREILLDVPRYDFHWQLRYELAEPRRLPAGTRLICTAVYDNSADNPANPNPRERLTWGDQTSNEMLIGFFTFVAEP